MPEVIYRMSTYTEKVDIWALGLVFAELLIKKKHLLKYVSEEKMLSQVATFCGLPREDRILIPEEFRVKIKQLNMKSWL